MAWTDDDRERALALLQTDGLAAAHHATGVPRPTIIRWADAAGIDRTQCAEHAASKTAAAVAAHKDQMAVFQVEMQARLASNADKGGRLESTILQMLDDALNGDMEALALLKQMGDLPSLSQIVGSRTRSIHDLQLLGGGATERPASAGDPDKLVEVGGDKLRLLRSG